MKTVLLLTYLIAVFVTLCACGSDSSTTGNATPATIDLPIETEGVLQEDFPLANYIGFSDETLSIRYPKSVSVDFPSLYVLSESGAVGEVDAAEESLPYTRFAEYFPGTVDMVMTDAGTWSVEGNQNLTLNETNGSQTWSFAAGDQLTELAINQQGWVYARNRARLIQFSVSNPAEYTDYELSVSGELAGVAFFEGHLYLMEADNQAVRVHMFDTLDSMNRLYSWLVPELAGLPVSDLDILPDGRVVVSIDSSDNNLIVLADKQQRDEPPLPATVTLNEVDRMTLPDVIRQPSGLWRSQEGFWYVLTDQSEVFKLDASFDVLARIEVVYEHTLCNQGCTEAISGTDEAIFVLNDEGYVAQLSMSLPEHPKVAEYQMNIVGQDNEILRFAGMGGDTEQNQFYFVNHEASDQTSELIIVDDGFIPLSRTPVFSNQEVDLPVSMYDVVGVSYYQGSVYVLSEQYRQVLKLSTSGEIEEVYSVASEAVEEPSDLFIENNMLYLIGDHEDAQETPPLVQFQLP
ncbi:hypothetical protein QWI17_13025 [Gilvimarinus sp. SDUM040013]|uniref:Uncharacterized protein n=1 Tax=Gilvimarinus gilvus TaxID=3058038 RepID=A0ABU4RTU4_9GAMM|nr:hypothetical protein [Gilvimarinus sp. SDUM040013]MDO3386762.1 hypothetical protein [Gilvimarinus sp. SDUM040013]MDX6848308.1 hypothetical protein [Gilvimarinus sp. SDUM040013]